MPDINDILAVILGGGRGARLFPLTVMRSKPAVPIAGKYRLIDIPISNCVNSGIFKIAVLTQFNSVSLHRHITQTYNFDGFHGGWVQIWAAEQTLESENWYQGTADAVRKQKFEISSSGAKNVLILAGDHLYRMDYAAMAEFHWANQADITVAVQPIAREDAPRFGILKREKDFRISSFVEKPADEETQNRFVSRDDPQRPFLGSMGIYLFKTSLLLDLLAEYPDFDDFGADVIPNSLKGHAVYGYDFDGYWRDIGTIRSFYDTNLELAKPNHPFNFYDHKQPIYTHPRVLPSSIIEDSHVIDGMIAEGCIIRKAEIRHSIIGVRSVIQENSRVVNTIMMGSDFYSQPDGVPGIPIGVGAGSDIEGAILDKNARIGERVVIRPFPRGTDRDDLAPVVIRDGIVVVPKDAVIPAGTRIAP
ncbi:MAG: Glucose-1-phosphate adenylyltransferase [Anaerolineales bacterium]|nr:Glucose-1-phosphate adenylyltransferase [Anaerolineales bacterium]